LVGGWVWKGEDWVTGGQKRQKQKKLTRRSVPGTDEGAKKGCGYKVETEM